MAENCFVTLAIKSFGEDQRTSCRTDQGFTRQSSQKVIKGKASKFLICFSLLQWLSMKESCMPYWHDKAEKARA